MDDLRARIARAIARCDDEPYTEDEDVYLLNADAVLAELGLEQVGWANVSTEGDYIGVWRDDPRDIEGDDEWEPVYRLRGHQ